MKLLISLTLVNLLQCLFIVTSCLAEHHNGQTSTLQPESQDSETLPSESRECSNSVHGIPGNPGIPGNSGFPGNAGPAGPAGIKGEDGQIGPIGPTEDGQTGQKGVQGKAGPQGETGTRGHPGFPGSSGPAGRTGLKGEDGQIGLKGDRGDLGSKGSTGQSVLTGQKGHKGQAGEIQHPSRMAFSVSRTSVLGPVSADTTVIYDRVHSNVGNGYSTSTGTFTCSVSGVYYFNISARKYISQDLYLCMMKNSDKLPCIEVYTSNNDKAMGSNSVIKNLQQGDEVWVRLYNGRALYSDSDETATFTGYLLYDTA